MMTPAFAQRMARYAIWQNASQILAVESLQPGAWTEDRGAFFGSIQGTLSHLLWADTIWMSRLAGWPPPEVELAESPGMVTDWDAYKSRRARVDKGILDWTEGLGAADLTGDLRFFSRAIGKEATRPIWQLVQHLFNHQTHHRGQVHAMLTAAGATPEPTDLLLLPEGI